MTARRPSKVSVRHQNPWIPAVGSQVPLPSVHEIDQASVAIAFAVFHTRPCPRPVGGGESG
jgi:hypothetical protein